MKMLDVKVECVNCGALYPADEMVTINRDGERVCQDCYDEYYTHCNECDSIVHVDDTVQDDWTTVCLGCCAEHYVRCFDCGRLVHEDDAICDEHIALCRSCVDDYYRCESCGRLIHADDVYWRHDEPYCGECVPEDVIHDYSYKPAALYFDGEWRAAPGVLYLGVELEVDGGGEDEDNAAEIIDILGDEYVYIKHDGSLEDGFEIVTHPSTLDYHKRQAWQEAFARLKDFGYRSHDARTCGLHIHLTRSVFDEVDEAKLLYLVEKFWPELVKFSRRTPAQLDNWARRYGLEDGETPEALLEKAKGQGRYYAVNLENRSTIELRLFRGTLKYSTFMATLEFCDYLFQVVKNSSVADIQKLTWQEFMANIPESYEFLPNYLKERGLM